ncbi:MAG: hypothetical protein CW346_15530 [Bacillaceae bacterium]|nr:hypothetical protein [Bacillaceae bacterium]
MPTDFVAAWLSFLGQTTYRWSRLPEPEKDADAAFYRLWLGICCLTTTLVLLYWFTSMIPESVSHVLAFFDTTAPEDTWLNGFYYLLNFMLWLLLSPLAVGFLYAVRNWLENWSLGIILLLWVTAVFCAVWRELLIMVAALVTPTFVCPIPPRKRSINEPESSRTSR